MTQHDFNARMGGQSLRMHDISWEHYSFEFFFFQARPMESMESLLRIFRVLPALYSSCYFLLLSHGRDQPAGEGGAVKVGGQSFYDCFTSFTLP